VVRPEDPDVVLDRAVWRMTVLKLSLVFALGMLGVRAGYLMLMPDERLQAKAAGQFQSAVTVEAPRGDILGRNGEVLATTVEMPSLHADPSLLSPEAVIPLAQKLSSVLGKDKAVLISKLSRSKRRDVLLSRQISPEKIDSIRALAPRGVLWTRQVPTRYYPGRNSAAQVLGAVGKSGRGLEGVELALDSYLRGDTFMYIQERDRRGRAISASPGLRQMARPGGTVQLTLHRGVQQAAEEALDALVERSEPLSASAVVVDVRTGEVLAVANRPTTNANDSMNRDVNAFINHAAVDAHEPGSVLKPLVMALAVEDGLVDQGTYVDCENGRWRVGGRIINDDHPHKVVTASEVIKYSSNIGIAKKALELGPHRVIQGLESFGFSEKTGLYLPAEVSGKLRRPDKIRTIELATTSYGQGMTATTLQLAASYATLGNGGMRMRPFLVSEIRDYAGNLQLKNSPMQVGQVVSPESAQSVVRMMETVLDEGGTGTMAVVDGYRAAGKTGTAQKVVDRVYSPTERVASFVGLVPANNPRIAIAVVVDAPQKGSRYGGTVAGPAFAQIAEGSMRLLGVPKESGLQSVPTDAKDKAFDAEQLPPPPTEIVRVDDSLVVPDMQGLAMRDVLAVVDGTGLELSLKGVGVAIAQAPAAGTKMSPGDRLEVQFQ